MALVYIGVAIAGKCKNQDIQIEKKALKLDYFIYFTVQWLCKVIQFELKYHSNCCWCSISILPRMYAIPLYFPHCL